MGGYPGSTMGSPGMTPYAGTPTPLGSAGQRGGTGSSFTQRLQNIIQRASTTGEIQVLGQTKIISDERTNSLLIYASKEDMKVIKDIVGKLANAEGLTDDQVLRSHALPNAMLPAVTLIAINLGYVIAGAITPSGHSNAWCSALIIYYTSAN